MTTICLGFEVGSGKRVDIPIRNMAVTGQTQESGKTTTLEALVARSGVTALAFVTKRGEGAFTEGRRIQPYFRDRADWQFVDQLLSAQMQEKNKPLRPYLVRLCRTTKTLQDVQYAVRRALKGKATGYALDIYTVLDAYLDLVVPEIERADLASSLDLQPGLNVMDVSAAPLPMQMLLVQSALDWVNERERETVVVIPEAWEMVPEGKGSPVKASATTLVRKGSALRNHIWLDSQDMAGVDKVLLRGCPVWLIGVQREANEIKRNLANIPAGIAKPKPSDVATLERGQFFACWGKHVVRTYVWPAWMPEGEAISVGGGGRQTTWAPSRPAPREIQVNEREATQLRQENSDLLDKIKRLEEELYRLHGGGQPKRREEEAPTPVKHQANGHGAPVTAIDEEAMYQRFLARLRSEDPKVLRIAISKPELRVEVERQVVKASADNAHGQIARLIADGFFESPRAGTAVETELRRRGVSISRPNAYRQCDMLASQGFLTKEKDGYLAVVGMEVNIVEG